MPGGHAAQLVIDLRGEARFCVAVTLAQLNEQSGDRFVRVTVAASNARHLAASDVGYYIVTFRPFVKKKPALFGLLKKLQNLNQSNLPDSL
jgi:hypothetical protein